MKQPCMSSGNCCGTKYTSLEPISSWITLAVAFFIMILIGLSESTFGILYNDLIDKYDTSRAAIGWAVSIRWIFFFMTSVFVSPLVDLYGSRVIGVVCGLLYGTGMSLSAVAPGLISFYVTYGMVAGAGSGVLYFIGISAVQKSFNTHRGLANGIMPIGFSVGAIIHPLHTSYLLEMFGVNGTLLIHGGLSFNTVLFVLGLKQSHTRCYTNRKTPIDAVPSSIGSSSEVVVEPTSECSSETLQTDALTHDKKKDDSGPAGFKNYIRGLFDLTPLKDHCFSMCVVISTLFWISKLGVTNHLVSCAIARDIDPTDAAYLVSIAGFGNIAMKVIAAGVMDHSWFDPVFSDSIAMMVSTCGTFIAAYCQSYTLFAISAALLGISDAMQTCGIPLTVTRILGIGRFSRGFALLCTLNLPGPIGATPLVGLAVDKLGNYVAPFVILGVLLLVAFILDIVLFLLMKFRRRKEIEGHMPSGKTAKTYQTMDSMETPEAKLTGKRKINTKII